MMQHGTQGSNLGLPHCRQSLDYLLSHQGVWASQVVLVVKNPSANAGDITDMGWIPGLGTSPGGGHGDSLQYSCLENTMGRGAWWPAVYGVAQSWTQLKRLSSSIWLPATALCCPTQSEI